METFRRKENYHPNRILAGCHSHNTFAISVSCSRFAKSINMKRLLMFAVCATMFSATIATAQVNMPAPSPTQTIQQDFGMGKIELKYSRPSIKGRPVFEANSPLAPLGKPWRTGANAATKITFSDAVTVGTTTLQPGSYVIYTVPGRSEWDVVFSKGTAYPGGEGFKASDDVVRVKATANQIAEMVETFTMQFFNLKPESCDLTFLWGNTAVMVPITTDIKSKLGKQVEDALKGDKKPYYQAATYYYEWDKNLPKALDNVNKAIDENKKAFWMYMLKARIQKEMGDTTGAKTTANKVIELAKEANNDDYVKMANELIGKA